MKKISIPICVVALLIAVALVWSSISIFAGEGSVSEELILFDELLRDKQALNFYPTSCRLVLNKGYREGAKDLPDSDVRISSQERCRSQRDKQIEKWGTFMESAESSEALGRALFYIGGFHYGDAYDNHSIESADLAVSAYEASLSWEPGSAIEGYSELDTERRKFLERARILRDRLVEEEKEKKQKQEQKSGDQGEDQRSENESSAGREEDVDGITVPVIEQGVKP